MKGEIKLLLDILQLSKLENRISDNLPFLLSKLNRTGRINELLELFDLQDFIQEDGFVSYKTGKIIVAGDCDVSKETLLSVAKGLGISRERFELVLDYYEASKYNYSKTQYNSNYSLIIVGPMPHSGPAKEAYSSVISAIENKEGYPKVIRLGSNSLKISKTNFKDALLNAIDQGIIIPSA